MAYRNGALLANRFRNVEFETVAGPVIMDEFGDKISNYHVLTFNPCENQFNEVFVYDPSRKILSAEADREIMWRTPLNRPPQDVPLCGFLNENPICHPGKLLLFYSYLACLSACLYRFSLSSCSMSSRHQQDLHSPNRHLRALLSRNVCRTEYFHICFSSCLSVCLSDYACLSFRLAKCLHMCPASCLFLCLSEYACLSVRLA